MLKDTICALVTKYINQNIGVIRVSGLNTFDVILKVTNLKKSDLKPNSIKLTKIFDINKNPIDQVLISIFKAPNSFTGEDVIEINFHGSVFIIDKIINTLLTYDIRMATPGEFSKRGFLNNKMTFLQAESINDIIRSRNIFTYKLSINNLFNKHNKDFEKIEKQLLNIITLIEVNIDYPEYYDVEHLTNEKILPKINKLYLLFKEIQKKSKKVEKIKDGIKSVIVGKPNVGKSMLLNLLINENKAIVSNIPGTTRDVVEGEITINNVLLKLIDTAGIRKTTNIIEKMGITKTLEHINNAQLIFFVFDNSQKISQHEEKLLKKLKKEKNKDVILIVNKTDLKKNIDINKYKKDFEIVNISAKNKDIDSLLLLLNKKFNIEVNNQLFFYNSRQIGALDNVVYLFEKILTEIKNFIPLDIVNTELQILWNKIQELMGKKIKDNLLDSLFQNFCIGK